MPVHHHSPPAAPFDRGAAFGEHHAAAIATTLTRYRALFGPAADLDVLGCQALGAIRGYAPACAAEIEGIAAGAGLRATAVAALNARTEILGRSRGECSTLVQRAGRVHSVQTWDWHAEMADGWFVWTIEHPDGRVVHTLTEYGILGKIGVAEPGIGVHVNILHHDGDGGELGVPVHIVARHVLDTARDLAEARALVSEARVSASSALTLVAAQDAVTAELHPGGPSFVAPGDDGELAHTNHFLAAAAAAGDRAGVEDPGSYGRLDDLRARLGAAGPPADRDAALAVLHSHAGGHDSICCHPDPAAVPGERWATLATVALDPAAGTMSVRAGGPCDAEGEWWSPPLSAPRTAAPGR